MNGQQFALRAWAIALGVAAVVVGLDQITKSWALSNLRDEAIHLFGSVRLVLTFNRGVAFGLGEGAAPILVAIAIIGVVLLMYGKRIHLNIFSIAAVGLVLGGAIGNVCDRLFRNTDGAVVDFIDIGPWPIFNLADSAIVVGAFALVLWGSKQPVEADE